MVTMLKKLAPRTVLMAAGEQGVSLAEGQDKRILYTVIGLATSYKVGESTFGPYVAFKGQFRAQIPGESDYMVSGTCFLPEPAGSLIQGALDNRPDGDKKAVQFAFDLGIVRDAKSTTKYQYTVDSLIEPEPETDALTLLSSQLPADRQLAAPAPKRSKKKD